MSTSWQSYNRARSFAKKPFFTRHEFAGSIAKGSMKIDDLHIVLEYPEAREGKIRGYVLGGQSEYMRLQPLFELASPEASLHSKEATGVDEIVTSDRLLFHRLSRRMWPSEYTTPMTDVVAEFELFEARIKYHLQGSRTAVRRLEFLLSGPQSPWPGSGIHGFSYDGNVEFRYRDGALELGSAFPGSVSVRPWFFYDKIAHEDGGLDASLVCQIYGDL